MLKDMKDAGVIRGNGLEADGKGLVFIMIVQPADTGTGLDVPVLMQFCLEIGQKAGADQFVVPDGMIFFHAYYLQLQRLL